MNKLSIVICTIIFAVLLFTMSYFVYASSQPAEFIEEVDIYVEDSVQYEPSYSFIELIKEFEEETPTEIVFDYACNFCEEVYLEEDEEKAVVKEKKKVENNNVTYGDKIEVTEYERTLLMRLLYCEACTGTVDEQRAVISVVFNRLNAKNAYGKPVYGKTIYDIVYYQYPSGAWAFAPSGNGRMKTAYDKSKNYREELYEQVDYVLNNGITVPENVMYFCSNSCYDSSSYFKNNHTVYAIYGDTTFMY